MNDSQAIVQSPTTSSSAAPASSGTSTSSLVMPRSEALQGGTTKTHGAKQIPDEFFWGGHAVGIVLMAVAVLCIVFAKGRPASDAVSR